MSERQNSWITKLTDAARRVLELEDFPESVCQAGRGLATGVGLFDHPQSLGEIRS